MGTVLAIFGVLLVVAALIWLVDVWRQAAAEEISECERMLEAIGEIDAVAITARSAMLQEALKAQKEQTRERE